MAGRSRSRSPTRRDRSRYKNGSRRGSEEPRRERKYGRDEEPDRDVRNDRYRRGRYEDDDERYGKRRSEPRERERERERSVEGDRRRGKDSRERDYREERRRDYRARDRDRERERNDERQAGPSTSRRHSRAPPSPRSNARSESPSSDKSKEKEKGKPNFNQSGLLAAATNTVKLADGTSTVLKYNEPPEARKPPVGWRLYVFKGKEQTDLLHINRQSCYLIGRDKNIVDIILDHPSCSKQHAVIQYRQVQEKDEFGSSKAVVKPFIIDLESTNSTFVNDEAIPQARYYELKPGDVIKFGMSTREYVLLHDEA